MPRFARAPATRSVVPRRRMRPARLPDMRQVAAPPQPTEQPALAIGAINDPLERQADRAAEAVLSGSPPPALGNVGSAAQRKCPACAGTERAVAGAGATPDCGCAEEHGHLQQKAGNGSDALAGAPAPSAVHRTLHSPGVPLDAATRSYFEPRFRQDFGHVRVHADAAAGSSAHAVKSLAYTVGRDIVFAPGLYRPHAPEGRRLLAHELAHVVQQGELVARPGRTNAKRRAVRRPPASADAGTAAATRAEAPCPEATVACDPRSEN